LVTILLVVHLLIAIALVVVILIQRSEGGGLGIGGSSSSGLISVRGTANLLTRATAVLAAGFMLTSLVLAILSGGSNTPKSVLDRDVEAEKSVPAKSTPSVPLSK